MFAPFATTTVAKAIGEDAQQPTIACVYAAVNGAY
jgi:hypothetical protein